MSKRVTANNIGALAAVMGTHRSPSSLDVISMCHQTDRMLKDYEFNLELQAWRAENYKDVEALMDQIDWLWESEESASTEKERAQIEETIGHLLSLIDELSAEIELSRPKKPRTTIGEILYVPVVYLLTVLRNVVLLVVFIFVMIAVGLAAIVAILKAI